MRKNSKTQKNASKGLDKISIFKNAK